MEQIKFIFNKQTQEKDFLPTLSQRMNPHPPSDAIGNLLLNSAINGNLQDCKDAIIDGAEINTKYEDGNTALHFASTKGHLEVVKYLIHLGSEKEAKNINGMTALHIASIYGHLEIVKYLLHLGLEKEAKNIYGMTALHLASYLGHLEVVKDLIHLGSEKEAKDINGWTALHLASSNGHLEVVKDLIHLGSEKEAKDNDGMTALHLASSKGHLEVVKDLIHLGSEKEAKDINGRTALHLASIYGHLEVVKDLIHLGSEKEAKDINGNTALDIASTNHFVRNKGPLLENKSEQTMKVNVSLVTHANQHSTPCTISFEEYLKMNENLKRLRLDNVNKLKQIDDATNDRKTEEEISPKTPDIFTFNEETEKYLKDLETALESISAALDDDDLISKKNLLFDSITSLLDRISLDLLSSVKLDESIKFNLDLITTLENLQSQDPNENGNIDTWIGERNEILTSIKLKTNDACKLLGSLISLNDTRMYTDVERSTIIDNVLSAINSEINYLRTWNPPLDQWLAELHQKTVEKQELVKKIKSLKQNYDKLNLYSIGWNREKQESTDAKNFYDLEDAVEVEKSQLRQLTRKLSRLKLPHDEEAEQLQDARLLLKETTTKLELEFVRLANLSVSYFPELKKMVREMARADFDYFSALKIGRGLSSYDDVEIFINNGRHVLKKAKYNDEVCILKSILIRDFDVFRKEIKTLSKLDHPNIIKIEAAFLEDNEGFIQMKFYSDGDLESFLNNKGATLRDIQKQTICKKIVYGLEYLHRKGIIHRDLKPQNILMSSFNPIISDFETSKDLTLLATQTMTSQSAVTPFYQTPDNPLTTKSGKYFLCNSRYICFRVDIV
jgi:ankyrin repeat protein